MAGESIKSGLTAGFAASAALGALMVIKAQLGLLPELNPIGDIVAIADRYTGLQFPPSLGWVVHFFIGTVVWGILYTWIKKILPGPAVVKGLIFGLLAWLAMMIVFMPGAWLLRSLPWDRSSRCCTRTPPHLWRGSGRGLCEHSRSRRH